MYSITLPVWSHIIELTSTSSILAQLYGYWCFQAEGHAACQDLGFDTGFIQGVERSSSSLPPWLYGFQCAENDTSLGACQRLEYGEASNCGGNVQHLECFPDSTSAASA